MAKILILGSGPAGVSAALYAVRGGVETTVINQGIGALAKVEHIENYYGFADAVSGQELAEAGISGAKRLGVQFVEAEVIGLGLNETLTGFQVQTTDSQFEADSVVLATGAARRQPKLPGLKELEGRGVSYCAVCDAFFYRGKEAAVLGGGEYALHEADTLLPHAAKVHVFTDGSTPEVDFPAAMTLHTEKITAIQGEKRVQGVELAGGKIVPVAGVFVAYGTAGSGELARKAGAILQENSIAVDRAMATNIPGLFAAGDCTGGLLQVAKAVYEGAVAGLSAVKYVRRSH